MSHDTTHDEVGLQRSDARAELVAVQRETRLEAEGVAGTEPGGHDPGRGDGLPELGRVAGGHRQLDPVLAGVARARHGEPDALPQQPRPR